MLTVGSLFSGIGGIDLGLERAGMAIKWQVEVDPWCRAVLKKHWPEVIQYGDVRELSGSTLEAVDVLCGGFPCQPVSIAGKRKAQADPRWLWPEFARLVDEVRPRYVIVENVPGLYSAGGSEIVADLATLGLDAEWHSVSASAFGAPHRRDRYILVAYPIRQQLWDQPGRGDGQGGSSASQFGNDGSKGSMAYSEIFTERSRLRESESGQKWGRRSGNSDGTTNPWAVEPNVGRVAYGVSRRVDRLRGLGNAVVPQVFEWVGEMIVAFDQEN